jgi:hypothetical protein
MNMGTPMIPSAGDPFTSAKLKPKPLTAKDRERLARLEDRYRHELMNDEERQELRDEIRNQTKRGALDA